MASRSRAPEVLLVTHSGDYYNIDKVSDELQRRGGITHRLDTDLFPTRIQIGIRLDHRGARPFLTLPDGTVCDPDHITAVWIRKIFQATLPEDVDEELAPGCRAECQGTLAGFWDALHHARFLDPPGKMAAAEQKIRQLRLAAGCGLKIPHTLVTNDPEQVRRLHREFDGHLVAKMLTALSYSMERARLFVHTSPVTEEDLADLSGLSLAPMVFQERIEKALELRVAYVGGRCFAGGIDAREAQAGRVDWRLAGVDECPWQPAELPVPEQMKLGRFMEALGLRFGALDFIRTPAGEYVFLEVNPAGEWGMLEKNLGLPISAAIAEELLQS